MELIVSLIGVPCVGKGSLIKAVQEKMLEEEPVAVVTTSDIVKHLLTEDDKKAMAGGGLFPREEELRDTLYHTIGDTFAFGASTVLLDGFPRFDDQLRWMRQMFYDREIQIAQVLAPSDFEIVRRAGLRNRDEFDGPERVLQRVYKQRELLGPIEQMISMYAIPYTSIINDDLERARDELIGRIKWPSRQPKPKKGKR